MFINEDGKLQNLPLNAIATAIFLVGRPSVDFIVGDAIVGDAVEMGLSS